MITESQRSTQSARPGRTLQNVLMLQLVQSVGYFFWRQVYGVPDLSFYFLILSCQLSKVNQMLLNATHLPGPPKTFNIKKELTVQS